MRKIVKIFSLLMIIYFSLTFSGCLISYFYRSKLPIEILSIKTFNAQTGEEIIGEYDSRLWRLELNEQEKNATALHLSSTRQITPINSAAPVFNYYVINVKSQERVTVVFEVYVRNNKGLSEFYLSHCHFDFAPADEKISVVDIIANGKGNFSVKYTCDVQENLYFLSAHSWKDKSGVVNKMSSRGGEVYNSGVFFNIDGFLEENDYIN